MSPMRSFEFGFVSIDVFSAIAGSLDGVEEVSDFGVLSCCATSAVAGSGFATDFGCGTANSLHWSAERVLWTLTLKNADEKSVLTKPVSGSSTAASATPPGCTKFIGMGFEETS